MDDYYVEHFIKNILNCDAFAFQLCNYWIRRHSVKITIFY